MDKIWTKKVRACYVVLSCHVSVDTGKYHEPQDASGQPLVLAALFEGKEPPVPI
jgi:hypothetical protein